MAKILLADDSGHAQRMGAKILSAEGHEVATVSNGQAALKMLPEFAPDLIVADVFMPGKTGYEVCQFIKSDSHYDWIPVLLMVGKMEPYDPVEGERVHADGVVTKPLESSDLVATVQKLLVTVKRPAPPPKAKAAEPASIPEPKPTDSAVDIIPPLVTHPPELEIPEELRQQPVSMIGELLEPQIAPPVAAAVEGLPAEETGPEEAAPAGELETVPLEPLFPVSEAEAAGIEEPLAVGPGAPELELSLETVNPTIPVPESPPAMTWAAESVAVTEEDKKLFEPPPPDWQGLVSMVQEEGEQGQFPAVLTVGIGGAGSQAEAKPATELSAVSVTPAETELLSAQTLRPEGTVDSERAGEMVPSSPSTAKAGSPTDSLVLPAPAIAPLDYATIQQIVRETVEELMPQIVDRIAQATGISFEKKG